MAVFAALQMTSSVSVGSNLIQAKELILKADAQGAKFILLPEHFAYFPKKTSDFLGVAERLGEGRIQNFLQTMAQLIESYLAGTVPLLVEGKVRQSLLVFDPSGVRVGRYDREHLFRGEPGILGVLGREEGDLEGGSASQSRIVETSWGKVGLSIGFDIRFPHFYQSLRAAGAEIILLPASCSYALGDAHWHILVGARAIENQVFFLAANQYGRHDNDQESFGESLILDPWGNVLGLQEQGVGVVSAEINLIQLEVLREEFPLA